jgi:Zn finger protein HypA/HybF involved in hydrogenase expression
MKSAVTIHCILCAREFTIPRQEYDEDEFRLYCPDCQSLDLAKNSEENTNGR